MARYKVQLQTPTDTDPAVLLALEESIEALRALADEDGLELIGSTTAPPGSYGLTVHIVPEASK